MRPRRFTVRSNVLLVRRPITCAVDNESSLSVVQRSSIESGRLRLDENKRNVPDLHNAPRRSRIQIVKRDIPTRITGFLIRELVGCHYYAGDGLKASNFGYFV
jgi:hypothetical protein